MTSNPVTAVDAYLDPVCPYSYVTACWLARVQGARGIDVRWHAMSLAILNADEEIPAEWQELMALSWGPVRLLQLVSQREGGQHAFDLIEAIGRRVHADERSDYAAVMVEALEECSLPAELADQAWSSDSDEEVRLSHKEAVTLSGPGVGSPVLAITRSDGEKVGFYGPIISAVPEPADSLRLWDGFVAMASVPGFFELKRARDTELSFD